MLHKVLSQMDHTPKFKKQNYKFLENFIGNILNDPRYSSDFLEAEAQSIKDLEN